MSRRALGVMAGVVALLGAVGGVVGNHLPWPAVLDDHPLWVTGGFVAVTVASAAMAVWSIVAGDAGVPAGSGSTVAVGDGNVVSSGGGVAVGGEGNVTAGPGGMAVGPGASVTLAPAPVAAVPLPPPEAGLCVGREVDVARAAGVLAAGGVVSVVGAPGIGKSTVLAAAVGASGVVSRFGGRRFVVACDGVTSSEALADKVALVTGVPVGDHVLNRVLAFLQETPCVLVLDNFESIVDVDRRGAEEFVARLRSGPGAVAVALGFRGGSCPVRPGGLVEVRVGPLASAQATEVLVASAGGAHSDDPDLASLVGAADGVPLALVLLGALARDLPALGPLSRAWESKRSDLLTVGESPDRTSSLSVSIELSWDRLSADGRAALALAALLPDGWPTSRFELYLPESLAPGVVELFSHALVHRDSTAGAARERCLAPIREHVAAHHAPTAGAEHVVRQACDLARLGAQVGTTGGASVVTEVATELVNIVSVIGEFIDQDEVAQVVPDILRFQRFTGLGDDQIGLAALAHDLPTGTRAAVSGALGLFYLSRSDNDRARELFDQALPLYQRVGAVLGEANTLRNLGELAFRESHNDRARELFDQALPLYQRVRDVYSEAITRAWLARVTESPEREEHIKTAEALARRVPRPGFQRHLRAISDG